MCSRKGVLKVCIQEEKRRLEYKKELRKPFTRIAHKEVAIKSPFAPPFGAPPFTSPLRLGVSIYLCC